MKFGLLGYGFMGGAHLAALQCIDGIAVTAVATRTRPSTDSPARGNMDLPSGPLPESVKWVPEWQKVIQDAEIDAVDICLPTNLHKEAVLAALENGKHVFCEKPMALTSTDCTDLLEAAKKSNRIFMVGQVLRFMFPYRYAAAFVKEVGREQVRGGTLQRSTGYPGWGGWLGKEECSGGSILDLLSHDLDQALSLFGEPQPAKAISSGPVDTMQATLHYPDGLEVKVEGGWLEPDTPFSASFRIEATGESLVYQDGALSRERGETQVTIQIPAADNGYLSELAYFVDCCRNNSAPDLCSPVESALAVEISNLLKLSREQNGKEMQCRT
jgi:predicted dehydrogenase